MSYIELARKWKHNRRMLIVLARNAHKKRISLM